MSQQFIVVYPPQLDNLPEVKANTVFIGYDPDTGKMVRIMASVVFNNEGYPEWSPGGSFDTDEIVIWELRFWKSLEDDNEGNIPSENSHWTEVSPSYSAASTNPFRGSFTPGGADTYPANTTGTGLSGAIEEGNEWVLPTGGTFNGDVYPNNTMMKALVNAPGNTFTNWRFY